MPHTADDLLITYGSAIRVQPDGRVSGYLVRFNDADGPDLYGTFFTRDTDYGIEDGARTPVYFNHRMPLPTRDGGELVIKKKIGEGVLRKDEHGILIDAILYNREEYEAALEAMGWSSGTASHLVDLEPDASGRGMWVRSWPLGLDASLTPTPGDPGNKVFPLRSLMSEPTPQADPQAAGEAATVATAPSDTAPTRNTPSKETSPVEENTPQVEAQQPDLQAIVTEAVRSALAEREQAEPAVRAAGIAVPAIIVKDANGETNGEKQAFRAWLAGQQVRTTMVGGTDANGGYAVPTEYSQDIVAALTNMSYLRRAGARVIALSGTDSFKVPSLTYASAATLTAESAAYTQSEPTMGEIEFNPYKYGRISKVSEELLADSRFDVWGQILAPDFAQSFAAAENAAFTTGTGSSQPQGVVTGATAGVTPTNGTSNVTSISTFDHILALYFALDYKYRDNAKWMMNDATLKIIRQMKDGANAYLSFVPVANQTVNGAAGLELQLLGKPVIINNSMATPAASARTILFGDFSYYWIADWAGLSMQRLNELYAANGHVGFRAFRRFDGNVVLAEAIQAFVQSAS